MIVTPLPPVRRIVSDTQPPIIRAGKTLSRSCSSSFFMQLSKTWDRGNKHMRERILQEFVENNKNKTGPQLERELGNGASLFLTRVTAWLRLTYLLNCNISLQLQAISIFISAASGSRFLAEFLEVGGVLTVLELLGLSQVKEADKAEALRLLICIANSGRKYKEFLCESYGVRTVADCLARSRSEITQDYCQNLLYQLGVGNPKFLMQVYKSLLSLLTSTSTSPTAQQMSGQALRMLLPAVQTIHPTIVDAALTLLKSAHIQIQYEGYELIRELIQRPNLQDIVLIQLIQLLKTVTSDDSFEENDDRRRRGTKAADGKTLQANSQWATSLLPDERPSDSVLAVFIQQAYAAKLLGVIAASSRELAERMIQLQIVSGLLNIIANVMHQDSQKYAANALIYLVQTFEYVADALVQHMGRNFFDLLEDKPDTFYRELTWEQVKYLRKNTVRINADDQREEEDGDEDSGGSVTSDDEGAENGDGNSLLVVPEKRSHRMSSHSEVTTPSAFPSNKNTDLWDTPERVETGEQKKIAQANANAQNQTILDEYEKNQSDEALVEDLYVPYGSAASNVTFAGAKFKKGGVADYSEKFNQELEEFRKSNSKKSLKEKEEFQVKFDEDMTKKLNRVKKEPGLFTKQHPALPKI
ncbi:armadillo-type protein [Chytriomyces cf. hyalinus JEL632]|nr:armadillo-type protein [Chytriomyces cf. hyalinus JEL632]